MFLKIAIVFENLIILYFLSIFPGLELSWRLASGEGLSPVGPSSISRSRSSSPYSLEAQSSSPVFPDPPVSPATLEIPPEQLPYVVGVSGTHPYHCQCCEKSFAKLDHLKHHEQVRSQSLILVIHLS